jgi:formamidopyrimidine-DNA glycosylase
MSYISMCGGPPGNQSMPELAEVEHYRRRWSVGIRQRIVAVEGRFHARVFRGSGAGAVWSAMVGQSLRVSAARGKQMLFLIGPDVWLGLHLGMTGELRVAAPDASAQGHDHLILRQRKQTLIFSDPRQFGRVRWHRGPDAPSWWRDLPEPPTAPHFDRSWMETLLRRHPAAPLKATLLRQECFCGVGNWMADEILWRAGLHPRRPARALSAVEIRRLWRCVRAVCLGALRWVTPALGDPPSSWLFPHRWVAGGRCPRDGRKLERATIGGRTTAWCSLCQRG